MKNPKDRIYECEVKRPFIENGERIRKWVRREFSLVDDGDPVRCYECKGRVRVHRQRIMGGPKDHVEHISRQDSEGCSLGHYYLGTSQPSTDAVE